MLLLLALAASEVGGVEPERDAVLGAGADPHRRRVDAGEREGGPWRQAVGQRERGKGEGTG